MNKKTLTLTFGSAIATVLTTLPAVHAGENPFAMQRLGDAQHLAAADEKMDEGGCSGSKMRDGKCGEGKCGAGKMKMQEGACSGKMQEGGCSGNVKQ
ncbi:MAG: hypothetical protein ACU837_07525 [Gammaproteobacteria bacterium]